MRCKNCGWPNKPNETTCAKCGATLESEVTSANYGDAYESPHTIANGGGDGLKKTVMESDAFREQINYVQEPLEPIPTVSELTCPKCGYPLRSDSSKCPNCNFQVNGSQDERSIGNNTNGYQRRPTRMAETPETPSIAPKAEERIVRKTGKIRGTINPYMMNIPQEPNCVLKPLQRMNERKPVEPVELEMDAGEVILTRDNTEPGNPSITSREQAVISYDNGRWFIENRSEQNTTFVLANKKIELQDGDIILLGNRMFEFTEQK